MIRRWGIFEGDSFVVLKGGGRLDLSCEFISVCIQCGVLNGVGDGGWYCCDFYTSTAL